jgi:hypothetical protein
MITMMNSISFMAVYVWEILLCEVYRVLCY